MIIALEGALMSFILLIICVIGKANGPVGLVIFYENEVKDRVLKLGLTTKEKIKKSRIITLSAFAVILVLVPVMVYCVNGARGFGDIFRQSTAIFFIMGLFDRIFIDWYWVGHTKAWLIPGTEDLMPYIPAKAHIRKWIETVVGYPILSAIISAVLVLLTGNS